jgi:hypothetical protein
VSRRTALWAAYWALVLTVAGCFTFLATIPFTGPDASAAAITVAAAIGWAGLTFAPTHRKDQRS